MNLIDTYNTTVDMNITSGNDANIDIGFVNANGNVNIGIQTQDSALRDDVYGEPHSDPKDAVLNEGVGDGSEEVSIADLCNDMAEKGYITDMTTSIIPKEFSAYLKSLGYDDEAHINYIWNLCQEMKFSYQSSYISEHEVTWSKDEIGGGGISSGGLVLIIREAIGFLLGEIQASDDSRQIANDLDRYFASDRDLYRLSQRVTALELEAEAVSRTFQKTAADSYCKAKIDMMIEYGFDSVKCGNTTFYHWSFHNSPEVTKVIGITPLGSEPTPVSQGMNIDYMDVQQLLMNYVPGTTKSLILDLSPKEIITNKNSITLYVFTNAPTYCQYTESSIFEEEKNFTSGQGGMIHEVNLTKEQDGKYEYYTVCRDSFEINAYYPKEKTEWVKSTIIIDTTIPELSCSVTENLISPNTNTKTKIKCSVRDANGAGIVEISGTGKAIKLEPCGDEYCKELDIKDLEEGVFNLSAHVIDMAGNENFDYNFAEITVDRKPPVSEITIPFNENPYIQAAINDDFSEVREAEFMIRSESRENSTPCIPTKSMYNQSGFFLEGSNTYAMNPDDGSFDSGTENAHRIVNVPFPSYCIYFHSRDSAGNWEKTKSIHVINNEIGSIETLEPVESSLDFPITGLSFLISSNMSAFINALKQISGIIV